MGYFWPSHTAWGFLSFCQSTVGSPQNHLSAPIPFCSPPSKINLDKLILIVLVLPHNLKLAVCCSLSEVGKLSRHTVSLPNQRVSHPQSLFLFNGLIVAPCGMLRRKTPTTTVVITNCQVLVGVVSSWPQGAVMTPLWFGAPEWGEEDGELENFPVPSYKLFELQK